MFRTLSILLLPDPEMFHDQGCLEIESGSNLCPPSSLACGSSSCYHLPPPLAHLRDLSLQFQENNRPKEKEGRSRFPPLRKALSLSFEKVTREGGNRNRDRNQGQARRHRLLKPTLVSISPFTWSLIRVAWGIGIDVGLNSGTGVDTRDGDPLLFPMLGQKKTCNSSDGS